MNQAATFFFSKWAKAWKKEQAPFGDLLISLILYGALTNGERLDTEALAKAIKNANGSFGLSMKRRCMGFTYVGGLVFWPRRWVFGSPEIGYISQAPLGALIVGEALIGDALAGLPSRGWPPSNAVK